jgi:isoaspartyl peptidase/L-asparaginase-like protein (Ntn-hydrolase superfamily)
MDRSWTRRRFLTGLGIPGAVLATLGRWPRLLAVGGTAMAAGKSTAAAAVAPASGALAIATWGHGKIAVEAAARMLNQGAGALDAVEKGVNAVEDDPTVDSVGLGGLPNEEGIVELDAALMVGRTLEAGSVAGLRHIRNPISVARQVMERTHHVMLVGEGALQFAHSSGFEDENLLTESSREAWKKWKRDPNRKSFWKDGAGAATRASLGGGGEESGRAGDLAAAQVPPGVHDTVGLIVRDAGGRLCVGVSTSGLEWKLAGRVGDSPIIGCGLYADDEVGAACGTGIGEAIIRAAASHAIVEAMRRGRTPRQACEEVVRRIVKRDPGRDHRVAFLAVNRHGAFGAASSDPEFTYALFRGGKTTMTAVRPLAA